MSSVDLSEVGEQVILSQLKACIGLGNSTSAEGVWVGGEGDLGERLGGMVCCAACSPCVVWNGDTWVQWGLFELQSASQPRLSYAEMLEDYPHYPDIHDLDLTLLNPRMIVVRYALQ